MSGARCGVSQTPRIVSKENPMNPSAGNVLCRRGSLAAVTVIVSMLIAAIVAASAYAKFEVTEFDQMYNAQDATPGKPFDDPMETQAGAHPFAITTHFAMSGSETGPSEFRPDEKMRDFITELPPGFIGDATAVPRCPASDFVNLVAAPGGANNPDCEDKTAVGVAAISIFAPYFYANVPVFNVEPPPGVLTRLGFAVAGVPQIIDVGLKEGGEYNVTATAGMISQAVSVFGATIQLWGVPADPAHDFLRGAKCVQPGSETTVNEINFASGPENHPGAGCPAGVPPTPFLTLPGSCSGPVATHWRADSWVHPGQWLEGDSLSHDNSEPPVPQGFTGCGKLGFVPSLESKPSSDSAETGTGLDVNVDFHDEGLKNPEGIAESEAKKAVVTLPEGVTINPSVGEGLGVCTPTDYTRETLTSAPGEGCPNSSKIGTLQLESPLIDEGIDGSVFLAQQDDPTTTEPGAENPFDSLIALYLVLRNPTLGVLVKLPMKVEPDPTTGQLVATLEDIPQLPFDHFNFHFREGQRAPLVTPAACGTYTTEAKFYPWSDPESPRTVLSDFQITRGKGGGPCPAGGVPPFNPDFEAGSENNNAASFSPFDMRLIREDGEQDMTKFSATLPPGVLGKLAGVAKCPDSAIADARAKTGRQELASPSCPANSEIGHTLAGAGVGSALTYVPGKIYLAGPYHGDPLSVIAITPAVAGPFDAGTVVVQEALTLNPRTAEVEVDGANSDPIPHIVKGIVLKLRDLRVNVDRPNFTLNPTNCEESSAKAVLFGSYLNVLDPSDDRPVDLSTRYQAANCLSLGFKPHLGLHLKGGTTRGAYPGLKAVYSPKPGDANVKSLVVRLPRSAFLEQGHIRTICTRVQYAAENCPKGAQYGYVKAWTPLLDEPLQGPVWLRSSNHKLPDMVFDLRGLVNVEVSTRIDSFKGGIRATVQEAPDAPISRVVLRMQGGKKGLIVNSRNLCYKSKRNHANVTGTGQNGKQFSAKPLMQARCAKVRRHKRHQRRGKRAGGARLSQAG
jgi:hypothetical protein